VNIETKIYDYIKNYFTPEDKAVLRHYYFDSYDKDDTSLADVEYQKLSKLCKTLIRSPLSDKYRIEVGPSCSFLINKIVENYIDDTTLVLTTEQEHSSVKTALSNVKNCLVLNVKDLYQEITYIQILKNYKQSKCNKVLLLMAGTMPGTFEVIKEEFFIKLRAKLTENRIPAIFILDDCQGCGFIFRDYNIFDGILATGHVFIPGFDMGILFTKMNKKLGYYNKTGLKHLVEKINIILKTRDKALQFNELLSEYFKNEIDNFGFEKFNNQAPHRFAFKIENNTFTQKQYDDFIKYRIRLGDSDTYITNISIRLHEVMIQSPEKILFGLKQTKKLLKKIATAKELSINAAKANYSNKQIIDTNNALLFKYLDEFYCFNPTEAIAVKQILQNYSIKSR
jgi:hypothetical protein